MDESKFEKRKYNKGHKIDNVWTLGVIEKPGSKCIILSVVKDRSLETWNSKLIFSVD